MAEAEITEDMVRNARHAYYGMIEAIDDKVRAAPQGPRGVSASRRHHRHRHRRSRRDARRAGMWYKQCFFEWSARVPLLFNAPARFRRAARRASHRWSISCRQSASLRVRRRKSGRTRLRALAGVDPRGGAEEAIAA
jgi:hypothetical protein